MYYVPARGTVTSGFVSAGNECVCEGADEKLAPPIHWKGGRLREYRLRGGEKHGREVVGGITLEQCGGGSR